jgi:DNA-binding transcriptional MerR regulator
MKKKSKPSPNLPAKGRGLGPNAESPLFFKLSDIAKILGEEIYTLRHWGSYFPNIKPLKINDRRLLYSQEDVAFFTQIKKLVHEEGYTLSGARHRLLQAGAIKREAGSEGENQEFLETVQNHKSRTPKLFENLTPPTLDHNMGQIPKAQPRDLSSELTPVSVSDQVQVPFLYPYPNPENPVDGKTMKLPSSSDNLKLLSQIKEELSELRDFLLKSKIT